MKKTKIFNRVHFPAEVIDIAILKFRQVAKTPNDKSLSLLMLVDVNDQEKWRHESFSEFTADYRRTNGHAYLDADFAKYELTISRNETFTSIEIRCPTRAEIEDLFAIFENSAPKSLLPEIPAPTPEKIKPRIFIGHGGSTLWRELKDHLQDKHGYLVEAYEMGARAGHAIRDVLEHMLRNSSLALLIMTGEDVMEDNTVRARQNVVHEIGLFQGRLGFRRAIVLLEQGTEEFSNIHGIEQIRFGKGNIKETFGEVLATLRREFPSGD